MFFITFEGIDQSGKSTQIRLLAEALEKAGHSQLSVREPGGTPLGDRIREMLLGPEHAGMDPWAEALLYAAARAQLARDVIRPALGRGLIVLSDRYIDSSLVYQGMARGLGVDRVLDLNLGATGGLMPDLTFVLHLDVEKSRERLAGRGAAEDRIEGEPLEFHRQVEEGYRRLQEMYPGRVVGVDGGGGDEQAVHGIILKACGERLGLEL
ncbi:MAG: dTMP kinase [Thermoleophilia bacterium]|nr:dTMP kinase [Thermoleophilia bacterium]